MTYNLVNPLNNPLNKPTKKETMNKTTSISTASPASTTTSNPIIYSFDALQEYYNSIDVALKEVKEIRSGVYLTQKEAQFLSGYLKDMLQELTGTNKLLKELAQAQWLKCDVQDEETQDDYQQLKMILKCKQQAKKETAKLTRIQKKLKAS